jgi:hypothetical protein
MGAVLYNDAITRALPRRQKGKEMSDTRRNEKTIRAENTAETRARIKDKLYKAKAAGELTEDDEAEILRYVQGVVSRRGQKPRD